MFFTSSDILSDEEAQEVAKLLHTKDTKTNHRQPNSLLHDSITASVHDSSGPVSLNDSYGPASLQEESVTEAMDDIVNNGTVTQKLIQNPENTKASKEMEVSAQFYESTSSLDMSTQDDEEGFTHSKFDVSISASDSGLIGKISI